MANVLQPVEHNARSGGRPTRATKSAEFANLVTLQQEQVEERCREIMRSAEDAALAIEQELEIQLVKLPKKVRQMSLAEFQNAHGGDLASAVVGGSAASGTAPVPGTAPRTTRRRRGAAAAQAPSAEMTPCLQGAEVPTHVGRTTRKRAPAEAAGPSEHQHSESVRAKRGRGRTATELQTPAPGASQASVQPQATAEPGTVSRVAQPGEVVYSERGSPILVPATIVPGPGARSRIPASQRHAAAAASALPAAPATGLMLTTCSRIARTAARTAGKVAQKHEPTVRAGKGRKKRGAAAVKRVEEAPEEPAEGIPEHEEVVPALALTTEDGTQIPLEKGLMGLPEALQAEATRQLESLKGLVDSLLSSGASAAASQGGSGKGGPAVEQKAPIPDEAQEEPAKEAGEGAALPKPRKQPARKKSAAGAAATPGEKPQPAQKATADNAKTPAAKETRGGRRSTSMRGVQKGKWVLLATDIEEDKFTQPVPGHPGSFYYVAKVLERDGPTMKIHYFATDGPNRKWFEGISRADGTRHVEERAVDHREIVAVFDGLTKVQKKIPAAVMAEVQTRLKKAPVTPIP